MFFLKSNIYVEIVAESVCKHQRKYALDGIFLSEWTWTYTFLSTQIRSSFLSLSLSSLVPTTTQIISIFRDAYRKYVPCTERHFKYTFLIVKSLSKSIWLNYIWFQIEPSISTTSFSFASCCFLLPQKPNTLSTNKVNDNWAHTGWTRRTRVAHTHNQHAISQLGTWCMLLTLFANR